jgi:succinate dehydrogenase / fumarate reductase membrane anchor subunit
MVSYRTSLSRARGLGSAHHGVGSWISERLSALALVPLTLWGVWSALHLAQTGYDGAVAWLGSPLNATLLALTLAIGFLHMHAGLRVVFEDYVHGKFGKGAVLVLNLLVCGFGAALSIFSVLKVAFGGGAAS